MGRRRGFFAELEHQRRLQEQERQRQLREEAKAVRERERAQRAQQRAQAQAVRELPEQRAKEQQADAANMTEAVEARAAELATVLTDGLRHRGVFSFAQLRVTYRSTPFQAPLKLATPEPAPQWERYAPPPPSGLARMFKAGHERAVQDARARFDYESAQYQGREQRRLAALAQTERRHTQSEQSKQQQAQRNNAQVDDLERRVLARTPEAVEDYYELLTEASPLPSAIPIDVDVATSPMLASC